MRRLALWTLYERPPWPLTPHNEWADHKTSKDDIQVWGGHLPQSAPWSIRSKTDAAFGEL